MRGTRFCRNSGGLVALGLGKRGRSEGRAVEQLCCGHDLACGASPLALANHVHDLNARDDLGGAVEALNPSIGRVRRLMAR